jgi:hypothetical protein
VLLSLSGNPFLEPLPSLVARGTAELFVYLRSLEDSEPQYEAKLLFVGEGKVGKSCLVDALRGKPFIADRSSTHGIQVVPLSVRNPDLNLDITLRAWGFGGQEVYRISHQFFFTKRALYLLVWNPREGQEQNEVEGWVRRIRLRVGEEARILIVATHADERHPELDYPDLKRRFGNILVGHFSVDNASGTGIESLRRAIGEQAARLPQMGQRISRRWIRTRDEILKRARDQPQIPFETFARAGRGQGLSNEETDTLARLLNDLGQIIYFPDDDALRDIVVLQPEWLTRAIHFVLEDSQTRQNAGRLDHRRLKEIWSDTAYPEAYHPYFLLLMEKFDVCYRFRDDERTSLVAQLVPYERPEPPWDEGTGPSPARSLKLICAMSEEAPGLVAWLTVRNHRFESGMYWRSGVFFRHERYESEALFELVERHRLALTVQAPSPDYFFAILRDSLEELITLRWPGLSYELAVPCPSLQATGKRCTGQFKFTLLQRRRERGSVQIECSECDESYDIAWLLTGFASPALPRDDTSAKICMS